MKRSLVVVAGFVLVNTVGFFAYRASYAVDAAASSLPTSRPVTVDTVSRDPGASQAKDETAAEPAVAAQPTSEPRALAPTIRAIAPTISPQQPTVTERTNSPTEKRTPPPRDTTRDTTPATRDTMPPARDTTVERRSVKRQTLQRADETPAGKAAAIAKPAPAEKPAAESKPAAEPKAADKPKDKVFEMEANPYKRGE